MAAIKAGNAGRLSIEIVAEIARLEKDMAAIKSVVKAASSDIARNARAANDNLASIGQGANQARNALLALASASKDTLTRIEAVTGVTGGAMRRSAADIAAYGVEMDRLRAKFNPLFATIQQYKASVADIRQAHAVGAISAKEMAEAISLVRQQSLGSIAAIKAQSAAMASSSKMTGAQRAGFQQLSMNLSDMTTMYMLGAKPAQIFASQIGQITQAVQLAAGGTSKFAAFLGGPWGMALAGAVMILGPFVAKLFESEGAAKDADKAHKTLVERLDILRNSYSSVIEATREYNKEQALSRDITLDAAAAMAVKAKKNIEVALSARKLLQAELEEALQSSAAINRYNPETGKVEVVKDNYKAQILKDALKINARQLDELTQAAQNSVTSIADEMAKINSDPRYAIEQRFKALRNEAEGSIHDVNALAKRLTALRNQEKAALDALSKSNSGTLSGSQASNLGTMKALLGQLLPGVRITSDTGGKHVAGSDHYKGRALDFVPAGGMGQYTKAEMQKLLEDAGVNIRRNASGVKQFFGPGDKGHNNHFHLAWDGSAPDPDKVIAAAKKAQEALEQMGLRSSESIQRISERFDEQPKLIDQVAQATRQLDDIMADLGRKNKKGADGKGIFDQMIADAQAAKEVVANGLMKPFRDYMQDQQQSMDVQRLTLAGREDEAQVMQVMLRLQDQFGTEDQLRVKAQQLLNAGKAEEAAIYQRMLDMYPHMRAQIAANIEKERELNDLLEKRQAIIGAYTSSLSSVRSDLEGLLGWQLSGKDFLKNLKSNYQQLQGKLLTEQLFGGPLRALEEQIRKSTVIDTGVADMKAGMSDAGQEAHNLAAAFSGLRGSMGGNAGTAGASGVYVSSGAELQDFVAALSNFDGGFDENSEIVVTAKKTAATSQKAAVGVAGMKPGQYADMLAGVMVDPLVKALQNLGIDLSSTLSGALSGYMQGGIPGAVIGGLKGAMTDFGDKIFGEKAAGKIGEKLDGAMKGLQTGTMAAGIMKAIGIKTSKTGAQIGGAIGGMIPIPGLDIVGSILGGIVGGALKKTKWARADVSGVSNDPYYRSNSGKYESGVSDAAKAVIDGLNSIADQLGGVAGEFASISIGIRDGSWRVNTNGKSLKTSGGAKDFGEDSAAAIAYAIQQAVQKGAISGIRASVLNLLQASGDFEAQLSKAVQLQNIFAEIAQSADPMGYELDQLAKKFVSINALLAEANATQEEYDQVAAYQKQQEAAIQQRYAEEAAAKRASQLEKEAELLTLQGKATQALAKSREAELLQMDAATQAIQKQIYAETDLATRRAMQIQLLEAQGNAEAAKAAQRAEEMRVTEDVNKALQEQIWLTQDLRDAYDRQTESIQSTIDEMKGLGDTLKDFRKSIYATDETALSTAQAMVKLMTTGALASTGDKKALGDLSTVGRDYLDAAKASAGSLLDYQRAQALVANYTDQAIAYTDNAVSEGEQQLALMKSQAESLISIDDTTQSFEDALNKLIAHNQSTAASTTPPAQNSGQQGQNGSNNGNNDMRDGFDAMRRMFEQMLRKWNQMAPEGPMQVEVVS